VNTGGTQNTSGSSASCTGNAASATVLATARTIGGVSFDGSAAINLPGVNAAGTQNTSGSSASCTGNAATATTTDNINGRAFYNRDSGNGLAQDAYVNNGIGYVTNVSLYSQTDGGMYASAYSTSWVHQIYGDFRTGQIAVRGKNNGTLQAWRNVLDSSNYTSYAPTLTGTGASGTWSINVTGNAGGSSTSCSGNAASATILQTARTIGGVSFNGSAAIDLPGVNTTGNQNTSGTSSNITAYTINQSVGTGSTPSFLTVRGRNVFGERVAATSAASTAIDTQYNVTQLTLAASTTLSFTNVQSTDIAHMWTIVTLGNGGVYSITWPAAIKWPGATAPTVTTTSGKRDIYQFITYDGGTNIYAIIVGQNL